MLLSFYFGILDSIRLLKLALIYPHFVTNTLVCGLIPVDCNDVIVASVDHGDRCDLPLNDMQDRVLSP